MPCFIVDEAAGLKFWTVLEMIHKLLDDKIATSPFLAGFTKRVSNKHPTYLQANLILVVLTCWGYVSVCELDVMTNISVDALIVNKLVSHFWDLETAQWYCRCLHGIVDVACVASLCFYLLCVVCLCCG